MTYIGFYRVFLMGEHIRHMKMFKDTFIFIRGYIGYAFMDIPEIFDMAADMTEDNYISACYRCAAEQIRKKEADNFFSIWKNAINQNICTCYLNETQLSIIEKIGHLPLHLDASMQLRVIDGVVEELDVAIQYSNEELRQKGKVYKCAGIIMGVFIVILLI